MNELEDALADVESQKLRVSMAQDAIKLYKVHVNELLTGLNLLIETVVQPGVVSPQDFGLIQIRERVKGTVLSSRALVHRMDESGLYETIPWNNANLPTEWDEESVP